jgi:hypothetical protein
VVAGLVSSAAGFDCACVLGGRIDSAVGFTGGIDSPFLVLNGRAPTPAEKKERKERVYYDINRAILATPPAFRCPRDRSAFL